MNDRFGTIFFALAGLVFAATGAVFLVSPELMGAFQAPLARTPDAINDVRAVYGGIELGLGLFFLACARDASLRRGGYVAAILIGSGAALSRFLGFMLVPETPLAHLAYGALDLVGVGFALIGVRRPT